MSASLLALMVWAAAPSADPPAATPRVVLRWVAVPGAAGYELELALDPAFREVVLRERVAVHGYRWNALPHQPHFWRVRSVDGEGRTGDWSRAERIAAQVVPPEPASPAQSSTVLLGDEGEVTLTAHPHPLYRGYLFELCADPAFATAVQVARAEGPAARLTVARPGLWHWRVRAVDVAGRTTAPSPTRVLDVRLRRPGRFGAPRSVRVLPPAAQVVQPEVGARLTVPAALSAPTWVQPAPDAVLPAGARVALAWDGPAQAERWEVRAQDAAPTAVSSPTFWLDAAEGEHQVQVRAVDEDGEPGPWTEPLRFQVGVPAPVRAEWSLERPDLVADGRDTTWVKVRLFDARGRQVSSGAARLASSAGALVDAGSDGQVLHARLVAPRGVPEGGLLRLWLEDRGTRLHTTVPLRPAPEFLEFGVRAGLSHNGGALASPHLGVEVAWRTRLLDRGLWLSARAGFHGSSAQVHAPELAAPFPVRAQVLPLAALATWRLPLGPIGLQVGAGPALTLVRVVADGRTELAARPGALAVVGAGRALGPGRASLEVGYGLARLDGELAQGSVGGLLLTAGYGVAL